MSRATNQLANKVEEEKSKHPTKYSTPTDENGRRIITKMTDKAWDILMLVVANGNMTQAEIAEAVESHQVYVSRVINSPCFQEELKTIKRQRIHDKLNDVMMDGADRMQSILNDEESADANAIAAFKAVAGAAGIGGGNGGGNGTNVNVSVGAESLGVTPEMIAEANERKRKKVFEGEFTEVKDE